MSPGGAPSVLATVRRDGVGAREGGTKEDETLREGGGDVVVRMWQHANVTFTNDCSQCFAADNATEPAGKPAAVQVPVPRPKARKGQVKKTPCAQALRVKRTSRPV